MNVKYKDKNKTPIKNRGYYKIFNEKYLTISTMNNYV